MLHLSNGRHTGYKAWLLLLAYTADPFFHSLAQPPLRLALGLVLRQKLHRVLACRLGRRVRRDVVPAEQGSVDIVVVPELVQLFFRIVIAANKGDCAGGVLQGVLHMRQTVRVRFRGGNASGLEPEVGRVALELPRNFLEVGQHGIVLRRNAFAVDVARPQLGGRHASRSHGAEARSVLVILMLRQARCVVLVHHKGQTWIVLGGNGADLLLRVLRDSGGIRARLRTKRSKKG